MPRSSSARCSRAGRRSDHRERGVPGTRRYGCHPHAAGHLPVGGRARAWCRSRAGRRAATIVSSSRCGNGNAGASTIVVAVRRATSRRALVLVTSQSGEPTSSPWIGQAVVVGAQLQPSEVDVDARGAVPARREAIRPRREQREPAGVPGTQRGDTTREREVLAADRASATRRSCPRRARTWRAARRCAVRSPACPGTAARRPAAVTGAVTSWARPVPGSRPCGARRRTGARRRA